MDGERFDAIARLMTTGRSRRALVRAALGSAGAAALARFGAGAVAAADGCRGAGRNCRVRADCCTRICRRGLCGECRKAGRSCGADANCCSGKCRGGQCAPCPAGEQCSGGQCCPPGYAACPGNPLGCLPPTSCGNGGPVCCSNNGLGAAILCGTSEGQCPEGYALPPATCPEG